MNAQRAVQASAVEAKDNAKVDGCPFRLEGFAFRTPLVAGKGRDGAPVADGRLARFQRRVRERFGDLGKLLRVEGDAWGALAGAVAVRTPPPNSGAVV